MTKKIQLLDCTLRDGAYINGSLFGKNTIKGNTSPKSIKIRKKIYQLLGIK